MTATRIDDVLNYLVALARAAQATTLADVTVQDGPWPARYVVTDADFLILGGDFDPTNLDVSAVTSVQTPNPMGNRSADEDLTVACVAVSQSGDPAAMGTCRAKAVATVEAFEDLLTADPMLGGLLQSQALLSVTSLRQVQTDGGPYCAVNFTVNASALIWNG